MNVDFFGTTASFAVAALDCSRTWSCRALGARGNVVRREVFRERSWGNRIAAGAVEAFNRADRGPIDRRAEPLGRPRAKAALIMG